MTDQLRHGQKCFSSTSTISFLLLRLPEPAAGTCSTWGIGMLENYSALEYFPICLSVTNAFSISDIICTPCNVDVCRFVQE